MDAHLFLLIPFATIVFTYAPQFKHCFVSVSDIAFKVAGMLQVARSHCQPYASDVDIQIWRSFEFVWIFIYTYIYIRRPLLARGHQAARLGNWSWSQILISWYVDHNYKPSFLLSVSLPVHMWEQIGDLRSLVGNLGSVVRGPEPDFTLKNLVT